MAACLHAVSASGLLALFSSIVVFVGKREESRFLAIQALQAALFQAISILLFGAAFLLLMAGFQIVAFSGLIAETGVTNPALTDTLIALGIGSWMLILFLQWGLPMIGVYAGLRILQGTNFRYPLIGRLAQRWAAGEENGAPAPARSGQVNAGGQSTPSRLLRAGANLLALFGLAAIGNPILWSLKAHRSQRDRFTLLQAGIYGLILKGLLWVLFFAFFLFTFGSALVGPSVGPLVYQLLQVSPGIDHLGTVFFVAIGMVFLVGRGIALLAAIVEFRGGRFQYPLIGRSLRNYLTRPVGTTPPRRA